MKRIISIRLFFCLLAIWAISISCIWIEYARAESKPSPEVLDQRIQGNKELHEQHLKQLDKDLDDLDEKKASKEEIQRLEERINSLNTTLNIIGAGLTGLIALLAIMANYYTKSLIEDITKKSAETVAEKTIKDFLEKGGFEQRLQQEFEVLTKRAEEKFSNELRFIADTMKAEFQQKLDDYYTLTQQRQALFEKLIKHGITPAEGEEFRELLKKTKPEERLFLADEWFILGYLASEENSSKEAIRCYSNTLESKPDFAEAYYNRAIAHQDQGLLEEAIADFTKAIDLKLYLSGDAYINRGIAYEQQSLFREAIDDYTKAIKLKPDDIDAYYNRGGILAEQLLFSEAINDYTRAIELNPHFAKAYNDRGFTYFELGQFSQAIEDCIKAKEIEPDFAAAYHSLGEIYLKTNDIKLSLENYTKAIELDSNIIEAYEERSIVYERLGKPELATADKQKAEELRKQKQKDTPQE